MVRTERVSPPVCALPRSSAPCPLWNAKQDARRDGLCGSAWCQPLFCSRLAARRLVAQRPALRPERELFFEAQLCACWCRAQGVRVRRDLARVCEIGVPQTIFQVLQ
eukprot:7381423-Prymnesium_polylepis.1